MSSEIEAERYWASVKAPNETAVVTGGTGDVSADVKALREDLARLSEAFAAMKRGEDIVVPARRSQVVRDQVVRDATDGAYGARTEIARSARRHAAAFADDLKATVRRNPQGTLLAAFGLGMVVGMSRFRRIHRFG